jgi:hypothetical protein
MALSNATLSAPAVNATILVFADFADLPIRGAYAPMPIFVPNSIADGDADCFNQTFPTINSEVLQIAPVNQEEGGSSSFAFILNADPNNPALLTAIENPSLYLGRRVRVWLAIYNNSGTVTEIIPRYRGYMTEPAQSADSNRYVISMQAENYLALLSGPQSRTYINSTLYDSGDTSGAVIKGYAGSPAVEGAGGGGLEGINYWTFER